KFRQGNGFYPLRNAGGRWLGIRLSFRGFSCKAQCMTIKMKDLNVAVPKVTFLLFLTLLAVCDARAQYPGIKDDIARYRTGELVGKAKPGAQVTGEQPRHEFWFGAAISNGLGSGSMPG